MLNDMVFQNTNERVFLKKTTNQPTLASEIASFQVRDSGTSQADFKPFSSKSSSWQKASEKAK